MIFYKIFKKCWKDAIQHKIVHNDGNFQIYIIEFQDEYYIIDNNSS